MKPALRNTNIIDVRQKVYEAIEFELQSERYPFQSCLNCVYFRSDDSCGLYGQKPPARIIVYSCEKYEDIEVIPF